MNCCLFSWLDRNSSLFASNVMFCSEVYCDTNCVSAILGAGCFAIDIKQDNGFAVLCSDI